MPGNIRLNSEGMEKHIAFISVGSNMGDKLENCKNGIATLTESRISTLKKQSKFYLTEPVGYKNQDWFVNSIVKIETILDPFQLFNKLQSIQRDAGRIHDTVKYGPRVLDLDIILFDNIVIDSTKLIIPHPRMHKRCFVLKPFCDIDPKIVHPVLKKDMQYLLDNLDDNGQRTRDL